MPKNSLKSKKLRITEPVLSAVEGNNENPTTIYEQRTMNYQLYSTFVECSLQIHPFLTNKANFRKSQMNITSLIIEDCGDWTLGQRGKNKANSNPIQSQFKPNSKPIQSQFKANSKPKQSQYEPNQTQFDLRQKGRKEKLTIDKYIKIIENFNGVVKLVIMN